jgi:hypothetical protein
MVLCFIIHKKIKSMPAQIHASVTNNQTGQIRITDVIQNINDYRTKLNFSCTDPTRNPVLKHHYFDLDLTKIGEIIANTPGAQSGKIRINLALNQPGQLNCENTVSVENALSLIVCAVNTNNVSLLREDDLILVEGFRDFGNQPANPTCCVQGIP